MLYTNTIQDTRHILDSHSTDFLKTFFWYPFSEKVSWTIEGVIISLSDLRRKVFNNGTLVLQRVVKESDEGSYTCTAQSRSGQKASVGTRLRVIGKQTADPIDLMTNDSFTFLLFWGKKGYNMCIFYTYNTHSSIS